MNWQSLSNSLNYKRKNWNPSDRTPSRRVADKGETRGGTGCNRKSSASEDDKLKLVIAQTQAAQNELFKLGEVTINIGQTIANSVGDAFEGVILRTSKLAHVGKNLMHALVRDVAQFFTQVMTKKLGFENLIFSNLRGFVPQANQATRIGISPHSAAKRPLLIAS